MDEEADRQAGHTVGSVTLNEDLMTSFGTAGTAGVTGVDKLLERLERDEFDLVAIGRSLIVNPTWPGSCAAAR